MTTEQKAIQSEYDRFICGSIKQLNNTAQFWTPLKIEEIYHKIGRRNMKKLKELFVRAFKASHWNDMTLMFDAFYKQVTVRLNLENNPYQMLFFQIRNTSPFIEHVEEMEQHEVTILSLLKKGELFRFRGKKKVYAFEGGGLVRGFRYSDPEDISSEKIRKTNTLVETDFEY